MFYYLIKNGQQIGPLTKEELQQNRISGLTMVWHEGLSTWKKAENIIDLKDILVPLPPPIPSPPHLVTPTIGGQMPISPIIDPEYDESYSKEKDASALGIAVSFIQLAFFLYNLSGDLQLDQISLLIIFLISILYRIIAIIWTVTISKRQNRDTLGWFILGLLLPSLALIIIGQTKKLFLSN